MAVCRPEFAVVREKKLTYVDKAKFVYYLAMGSQSWVLSRPLRLQKEGKSLVFEYKYEQSADPQKLDQKLLQAAWQIKSRNYGHNADSLPLIALFALVEVIRPDKTVA